MKTQEKAKKLYQSVNTFILTCNGADGYPLTKAVVPGKHRETLSEMYFATNTSSKFAEAVSTNSKANVYFYKRELIRWQGCLLKGEMEIVEEMGVKKKYWQEKFKGAYEQKSYTDPDFCVLKFTPHLGRFYANFEIEDFEVKL